MSMLKVYFALLVLLFAPFLVVAAKGGSCQVDPTQDTRGLFYTTTSSVVTVDISQVSPSDPTLAAYLLPTSALGYLGPIGPYGPLGTLGPLGQNTWNPSYWISGLFSWDKFSKQITGYGGPLSSKGPLGPKGPMTDSSFYGTMPCINSFAHQMLAGGLFSVLGPLGPLGALGPLGPLGPVGAHGFIADSQGNYVDSNGAVQRTVTVPYDSQTSRTFDFFEIYEQGYAASGSAPLDTSFGVYGTYASFSSRDSYTFTSSVDQVVTILVVPAYQLDAFSLTLEDSTGTPITKSDETTFVNWVQIKVSANTQSTIRIKNTFHGHILGADYRLFVVGSTSQFQYTDITGPHQTLYNPASLIPIENKESAAPSATVAEKDDGDDGLSGVAIAGIVMGSVIGAFALVFSLIIIGIFMLTRKLNSNKTPTTSYELMSDKA